MRPVQAARVGRVHPHSSTSPPPFHYRDPKVMDPQSQYRRDPALHPGLKDVLPLLTDLVPCLELTIRKINPSSPGNLTKMTPRLQRSQDSS